MHRAALLVLILAAVAAVSASPARALTPEQTQPEGVASLMRPNLDAFWSSTLGARFSAPGFAWYAAPGTACGVWIEGPNSLYCPLDSSVYLDYNWHRQLIARRGDFASAFVFAHEYAHHVQRLRGFFEWASNHALFAARELQADCYAGLFTRWAFDRGLVTQADLLEASRWLQSSGDAHDWEDAWAHGTGTMRNAWFRHGIAHRTVAACDLVYRRVHGTKVLAPVAPKPKAKAKPAKPKRKVVRR